MTLLYCYGCVTHTESIKPPALISGAPFLTTLSLTHLLDHACGPLLLRPQHALPLIMECPVKGPVVMVTVW